MKIIWTLVNCNSLKEADAIGKAVLKKRHASCFDIFPRASAVYFWPPKSGNFETSKGCLLVLESLPKNFSKIKSIVKKIHRDKLSFIGTLEIGNVGSDYVKWMKGELRAR